MCVSVSDGFSEADGQYIMPIIESGVFVVLLFLHLIKCKNFVIITNKQNC